jgi:hypothetical protein
MQATRKVDYFMSYCLYLRKSRTDMEAESRCEGETLARDAELKNLEK